jgi:hypothetical protein
MIRAALLAGVVLLTSFPACREKVPPPPKTRSRKELYKPLPTPAAPRAVPGHPTPKRAFPD